MKCFIVVISCVLLFAAGCKNDSLPNQIPAKGGSLLMEAGMAKGNSKSNVPLNAWALYRAPDNSFTVTAPTQVELKTRDTKGGKFKETVFRQGDAFFSITFHTDRKGALAGNSVEELKSDTSDYLPDSLKEISLGEIPGIEFRTKGKIGVSVFREYCKEDNSLSISIQVLNDPIKGFSDDEVFLLLESFRLID